jgi:hypothetical protein
MEAFVLVLVVSPVFLLAVTAATFFFGSVFFLGYDNSLLRRSRPLAFVGVVCFRVLVGVVGYDVFAISASVNKN